MAASEFVGFRLNYKKDDDILKALGNAKDKTKEIKRLLRVAIATPSTQEPKPMIDWNPIFQSEPKVKPAESGSIVANILGGFD